VQSEVERSLLGGKGKEDGGDVGGEVAGARDDEKGVIREDAGSAGDGGGGDAAITFTGDRSDSVVRVGWKAVLVFSGLGSMAESSGLSYVELEVLCRW
jgi:hypothetical protein